MVGWEMDVGRGSGGGGWEQVSRYPSWY